MVSDNKSGVNNLAFPIGNASFLLVFQKFNDDVFFFEFIIFGFTHLLESIVLCLLLNLESYEPLFL